MKIIISLCLILMPVCVISQEKPVKIVFDVTSSDHQVHETAMRHVTMMAKAYPESQFEVVIYSGAIDMVLDGKSSVRDQVVAMKDNSNVTFKVCEATMNRHKVTVADLLPGVETVPDGILEIVNKQSQGWGYIKEAPNN